MSRSSENMRLRQQARNGAMSFTAQDEPRTFEDIAPKGPLQVKNRVIGTLIENGENGLVIPDPAFKDTNLGNIRIDRNNLNGAPFKMTVVCEILNPGNTERDFRGRIIEVLGDPGSNDSRMLAVLRQFGLSREFPAEVMDEVMPLPVTPDPETIEKEIRGGRKDLRDLLTITIDGEEAKDLDDAISLQRTDDGNYRLFVHIADVSHYVRENTSLDSEAMQRGTSVYLVDRVIPMLPPKLSNGLCSLNPEVDRLTMTAEMYVDRDGHTYDGNLYESVIRSDMRMSYNECFRILTEPQEGDSEKYGDIVPMLREMKTLAEIIKRMRSGKGALTFDLPETKVILNDDGTVKDIMPYPINFCHGIIEQFMICANEYVAEKFARMNYPFVYRVHEDPDQIKIARFCHVAKTFGAQGRLSGKITPLAVASYMDTVKDDEARPMLDSLLLRSMAKARYASENLGHFGLASKFYCHFTSPIRRYPDLYIHRIIKSFLHKEDMRKHFLARVSGVADHSSEMEQNSVDAERVSVDIKACEYMKERLGEHYPGTIVSIIASGCFVRLPNSVEGFVPFRTMRDHYVFDERAYRAIGSRSGKKLTIGMSAGVIVAAVDTELNRIDLAFEDDFEEDAFRLKELSSKSKKESMPGRRKLARLKKSRGKRR